MSLEIIQTLAWLTFSYLLGSISSAILICRLFKLPDPREQGSNNPGATNVLRIGGKLPAALTLLGDALKAVVPVLLVEIFTQDNQLALAALSLAFLGHLYPIFFKFQGGKGVATYIGGLLAFNWVLGLGFVGTWLIVVGIFRLSSLGAIMAAILTPVYSFFYLGDWVIAAGLGVLSLLLLVRHKANIQRILSGQESKVGKK